MLDFSDKLKKILDKYGDDVTEATKLLVKKSGDEARNELKATSPRSTKPYTHYADGWTARLEWSPLGATVIVHQSKKPGLTHLLENGHANRNGGRTPAHVHIKPVREEIVKEFEKQLRTLISNV